MQKFLARFGLPILLISAVFVAAYSLNVSTDRNALWRIAHERCVRDEMQHHDPKPCAKVDLGGGEAKGYVILKDIRGKTQFLLIPTRKISGIESPAALAADLPNYFADAWANRSFVEARAGHALAWNAMGLAINAASARSQDQMHIHIDCVREDVRDALAKHQDEIAAQWAELPFDLAGRRYVARRLSQNELAAQDPFKLVAELSAAKSDMAEETLAMLGVTFGKDDGFVLLASHAESGHGGHSEDLLDHSCALAK